MAKWISGILLLTGLVFFAVPARSENPFPKVKSGHYVSNVQHAGGSGAGFALYQIRWGDHREFERIVFEFSSPRAEESDALPRMKLETEFYPFRLALRLPGSGPGQTGVFTSKDPFQKSALISHVDFFDGCKGGQHLFIIPARPVEFDVFTLTSPPRLVVDIIQSRMEPMREAKKLSLRTLPLFGDQICYFLEETADAGITSRVLVDGAGNMFGEVGLFDTPDEAFNLKRRLESSIGRNFALIINARGMMETPEVLP